MFFKNLIFKARLMLLVFKARFREFKRSFWLKQKIEVFLTRREGGGM